MKKNLFGNWLWWKRFIKPALIILFFWMTVFSVIFVLNHYYKNNKVEELSDEVTLLKDEIIGLNEQMDAIEDDIVLKSILKLQPKIDLEVAKKITASIIKNCMEKKLSPHLIVCLIYVESSFNQMATSNKLAIGLMQVHWDSWNGSEICANIKEINDLYQIDINIDCGTSILKKMITDGGSIRKGLNSYYGVESQKYHGKMAKALYTIMF
jgi:hypothetical protein